MEYRKVTPVRASLPAPIENALTLRARDGRAFTARAWWNERTKRWDVAVESDPPARGESVLLVTVGHTPDAGDIGMMALIAVQIVIAHYEDGQQGGSVAVLAGGI